jgi:hypothetical protein
LGGDLPLWRSFCSILVTKLRERHDLPLAQAEGALDFFYLAEPACLPGGPGFSFSYYSTWCVNRR